MKKKIRFYLSEKLFEEFDSKSDIDGKEAVNHFKLERVSTILFFGLLFISLLFLFQIIQDIKRAVGDIKTTYAEILTLSEQGKTQVAHFDLVGAKSTLVKVESNIADLQYALYHRSYSVALFYFIGGKIYGIDDLLLGMNDLIQASSQTVEAVIQLSQIEVNLSGTKAPPKENLELAYAKISASLDSLTAAQEELKNINAFLLPNNFTSKLEQAIETAKQLENRLIDFKDIIIVLQDIFIGDKQVFFAFQNNNELRPTGGFIGTVGEFSFRQGALEKSLIHSVYDLDGQLKQVINPPKPLLAVNNRWYLRDSNWFADFTTSAKQISLFYEREGGETPDFVIAITPEVLVQLLTVTGPINLPKYQTTITADNFLEKSQIFTSVEYDKLSNTPKQMLADLFPILLDTLVKTSKDNPGNLMKALTENALQKELLIYARNPESQNALERLRISGQISDAAHDYLYINFANLGGTKTDQSLETGVILKTLVQTDGTLRNELTITRKNPLSNETGLSNRSYIRILVPKGSTFISANGFSESLFNPNDIKLNGTNDAIVDEYESNQIFAGNSLVTVGTESGKTTFSGWSYIPGGTETKLTLVYTLPFKFSKKGTSSLLVQKQPGQKPISIDYSIENSEDIKRRLVINTASSTMTTKPAILNSDLYFLYNYQR